MPSIFSWELEGSMASLLGTGVMLGGCLTLGSSFVRVDSLRHGDESRPLAAGLGVGLEADLEKNCTIVF